MKRSASFPILLLSLATFAFLLWSAGEARAWERYHDPSQNDKGYCSDCHPGFTGGKYDTLHQLHTGGSDPMTGNCDLCHTDAGKDNPFTMWSALDNGNGKGCMGCHGRDYGETIAKNYNGFPTGGKPKSSGYGLRLHHKNKGVTVCFNCHADVNPSFIKPEYVDPVYYARQDVNLGGEPLFAADHEDTANDPDAKGLDNDGDMLYEADDPDCALTVDTHVVFESTGGSVHFALDAGAAYAGRNYLVLGSISGTSPGTPLPGGSATLPLNWDIFTNLVMSLLNTPVFQNFMGNLDPAGTASASLNLGPVPGAAGLNMYYAFAIAAPWDFASNPSTVLIKP